LHVTAVDVRGESRWCWLVEEAGRELDDVEVRLDERSDEYRAFVDFY
jgi:hypothetical protein